MLIFFTVILGVLGGSVLALILAFHTYNLVGIFIITGFLPPLTLISLMLGLIIGFSIVNTIPSIYLSAPDESAIFLVLPGQKYMLQGRGHEACMLSGIEILVAIFVLLAIFPLSEKTNIKDGYRLSVISYR